ncbi:hypothetical protein [Actinoplanes sp. G11-F43]|uniref:hypothetical protein n=1 Tax=Actinoplanes sp. G11-F43 TaxID=3424130 RepID=UPI003D32DD49
MRRLVVASVVLLSTAACTTDPPPAPAPSAAAPAMTVDEAHRLLPMDGAGDLTITWDPSPDTDEVQAARRSLALNYWMDAVTDWTSIIPVGRMLSADRHYREVLAPFAESTDAGKPASGPMWVKTMGAQKIRPYQVQVTFCTDLGHLREDGKPYRDIKKRANLETYLMQYVTTADGNRGWRTASVATTDFSRAKTYGPECTRWARHQP